ncbi:hypothetical protein BDB00DRAFT_928401 [Zychaea mexicana]|uniref:uncharacterized protein n=1 Tax=Zychaea mexicana TaxID=64656 RepID=UPI0022FE8106|nr:uncharacterized protein BDB00DRAFT_928401 [Zychaea mexicana]KAI9494300.1 hypothetical protein BDB00DRAFT_928401 [Zychaea mexicana]
MAPSRHHSPTLHFENAFWSQKATGGPLPDFQTGLQVLHNKLNQSKVENDEIIQFFKERIAIEDNYANRLGDQAKGSLKSSGFGRDDGAVLKGCFENMRAASGQFSMQHKQTVSALTDTVLKPLNKFQDEYKRSITTSKQSVDAAMKQFDGLVKEMDRAKTTYQKRWKEAVVAGEQWEQQQQQKKDEEEKKKELEAENSPSPNVQPGEKEEADQIVKDHHTGDGQSPKEQQQSEEQDDNNDEDDDDDDRISVEMILIGNQRMSRTELNALVERMRSEIRVGDYRVPILGKYQNTSTGEDISVWLQHTMPQCKDSPAMADVVAQQLIHPLGVLRLVGQRGNKFAPSPQSYYQWQQLPQQQQHHHHQQQQQQQNNNDEGSASTSNYGFGFFERIGGQPVPGEEVYKRAQREATLADETYRAAVKRIDQMRMVVEQALFAHFAEMEQVELKRLAVLKQAIASFSLCLSEMLPGDKAIVEEMLVYQESLKPEQDIQYIVQQYCVSGFSPKPILYDNQNHGVAHDQIFGVSLDDLGKMTDDKVPKFARCLLEAIELKASETLDEKEKHQLWSTRLPLDRIHAICADLNIPSSQITTELLQQYEPMTLVAILRLYLLELPECLMTFEFYDAVQALYATTSDVEQEDEDTTLRLPSLSNLIATLPGTHFATLRLLSSHIHKAVQQDDIQLVSRSLGPVILRPRIESLLTMTSPMPTQFARDLLRHHDVVFSEATLKSHTESEKRRQARPLIATHYSLPATRGTTTVTTTGTANHDHKAIASDPAAASASPTKQRRGIMSFMRSNNNNNNNNNNNESNNNSNTDKWMGVFQRNNSVSSSSSSTHSSSEQQRSSFTRPTPLIPTTAITQGSPPTSPTTTTTTTTSSVTTRNIKESPRPSSVATTATVEEQPATANVTTKQIVFDATEESHNDDGELDPFFDDD